MLYSILLPLALILFLSKFIGILFRKIGIPQVVTMLLAGIIVGVIKYIPGQTVLTDGSREGLSFIGEIGAILIMFSAGIETDLRDIKRNGAAATVITALGVVVPLGLGFIVASAFNGGFSDWSYKTVLSNLFYGVILTATSVSITVAALKEMGKLNSKVGVAIVSAAIIDDIIGIVLLSLIIGMKDSTRGAVEGLITLGKTAGFFAAAIAVGIGAHYLFIWMDKKWPNHRRVPIFGLALCFFYSYAAEKWFGVADITGAYLAGLMLTGSHSAPYIDRKVEIASYMIFAPVFFAGIGINTSFSGISASSALFGVLFVLAGIAGKFIGCGVGAAIMKFNTRDSVAIGIGMMVRAEVILVCTQKGLENNMISSSIVPFVVILILTTSFLTPMLLKLLYRKECASGFLDGGGTQYYNGQNNAECAAAAPDMPAPDAPLSAALPDAPSAQ